MTTGSVIAFAFILGFVVMTIILLICEPLLRALRFKQSPPQIGEVWSLKSDGIDPWSRREVEATIVDVKDGWVRYSLGGPFSDERRTINKFVKIYERLPTQKD